VPELPDLEVYRAAIAARCANQPLSGLRLVSLFVLRSVEPALASFVGHRLVGVRRLGKRLVLELAGERFLVIHLRVAGRLAWWPPAAPARGRSALAAFDFPIGTLLLTEAATKKRASLHLVLGEAALAAHDPGGVEPLVADDATLRAALTRENRTLKRALTDPTLVAGIGNAYSDEILWAAELSPFARTGQLGEAEWLRLLAAIRGTLAAWCDRLREEAGEGFPANVTAFRPGMAVHGRFGQPCPRCGAPVQRIVYAENEANYCARCQTDGRLLADRTLSRLLHDDWPRTLEELEERRRELVRG
jgi:formamidopyrimidine-DNA glycosylase